MVDPIGFRFRPTDEEMVDYYLRLKNLGSETSHVDGVISTVNICNFDPWDLPSKSMIKSGDGVWYFFCVKDKKYNRGDQQTRKTQSGFWKKTGKTSSIMRKRGNREKIGEKRVLVFKNRVGSSKSDWVMHEYHSTLLSPPNLEMMMTYTICKVEFKGDQSEISSSSTASEIPSQFSGEILDAQQETQLEDAVRRAINRVSSDDWNCLFDDDEQSKVVSMHEDCSDYIPQKPLTGLFDDPTSDDDNNDSVSISATTTTTNSILTSSTCDSFGSSNYRINQINTQQSPDSSIKLVSLAQEVSQALGQGTEIREHKLGQETVKKKRASFFYRMFQRFVKKRDIP